MNEMDKLLATHDMSAQTATCRRCGFAYAVIVAEGMKCGKAAPAEKKKKRNPYRMRLAPTDGDWGWIRVRTIPSVRDRLIAQADNKGVSVSAIVREALSTYLEDPRTLRYTEEQVLGALGKVSQRSFRRPVELDGARILFAMTSEIADMVIQELRRGGRRGKP